MINTPEGNKIALYGKLHPQTFAWILVCESNASHTNIIDYGCIAVDRNLIRTCDSVQHALAAHASKIDKIYLESLYIVFDVNAPRNSYKKIQLLQQTYGAIQLTLYQETKKQVYKCVLQNKPVKDDLYLMFENIVEPQYSYSRHGSSPRSSQGSKFYTNVEKLCISECILLYQNVTKKNTTTPTLNGK